MFWKHTAVVIACTLPFVLGGCDDESEPGYEPAQPTRGMVELAVNITGTTDLDRDGVVVRFAGRLKEMNSQEMWVFGWEEGEYEAQVSGVKANCAVQGGATHALSVVAGETRSLTIEIVCEPLGPAQIEFLATTANIVKISDRDSNFETGELEVGCWEDALTGPWGCVYSVFLFDGIEEVMAGRVVKSATLVVYPTSLPPSGPQWGYEVMRYGEGDWDAQTLTYNTRPPRLGSVGAAPPMTAVGTPVEVDLTELVQNWNRGIWLQNGIQLIDGLTLHGELYPDPPSDNRHNFESDDTYTDHSHCPHLLIEFE